MAPPGLAIAVLSWRASNASKLNDGAASARLAAWNVERMLVLHGEVESGEGASRLEDSVGATYAFPFRCVPYSPPMESSVVAGVENKAAIHLPAPKRENSPRETDGGVKTLSAFMCRETRTVDRDALPHQSRRSAVGARSTASEPPPTLPEPQPTIPTKCRRDPTAERTCDSGVDGAATGGRAWLR